MKCPKCKNDFRQGVSAAYRLGILDGKQKMQLAINHLATTNRELFDELTRLDRISPLPDADLTLRISHKRVKSILKYLKYRKKDPNHIIRMLNKIVKEQLGNLPKLLEKGEKKGYTPIASPIKGVHGKKEILKENRKANEIQAGV